MGVIQRQGIKSSLLNYISILIGAASIVFIYPQALAEYGLITFLTELAIFTAALSSFCLPLIMVRFFPEFKDETRQNNGFLAWSLLFNTFGFLVFTGLYFLFRGSILDFYSHKSDLEKNHIDYLLIFTLLLSFINLFNYYCTLFQRLVISSLGDFLAKLARPALVVLYLLDILSVSQIIQGLCVAYLLILLILVVYTRRMGKLYLNLRPTIFNPELNKKILLYSGGATLLVLGSSLGLQLDRITVSIYLDMKANGVYGTAQFITGLINVPLVSLVAIASPIAVQHFKDNKIQEVQTLYLKSAEILSLSGVFICLGIVFCVDDLFKLTADYQALSSGIFALFILAASKLFDCVGSISRGILELSDRYYWGLAFMGLAVLVNFALSIWLIPQYGLVGVALSNFCAVGVYTLARIWILWHLYGLWPISRKVLGCFGLGLLVGTLVYSLPLYFNPIINMPLKGLIISILYLPLAYYWRLSEDFSAMAEKGLQMLKTRFSKR